MTTQKQVVISAIIEVTGSINGKVTLTSEQRKQVLDIIAVQLVEQNCISADATHKDLASLRKHYVSGLLTNWMNKAPELNGGVKYEAKNPGSRTKDATLQALKAIVEQFTADNNPNLPAAVEEYNKCFDALKKAKAKTKSTEIDFSVLPAETLARLNLQVNE